MNVRTKDVGLILSLLFIFAICAYLFMQDLKNNNFDRYLSLLGEKLLAMIPESSEKRTLENMFTDFRQDVKKKKVEPEKVEQVAAGIMNIANISDTISIEEAQAILNFKNNIQDSLTHTSKRLSDKKAIDEKRWQEMQKRIESVYLFNEAFKERSREIVEEPHLLYNVGDKLHVIIDSKLKSDSLLKFDSHLGKELKQLEDEDLIIWQEDFNAKIQEKLKEVEMNIKIINKDKKALNLERIKILENLQLLKSMQGLDSVLIEAEIHLDSLDIPPIDIKIEP